MVYLKARIKQREDIELQLENAVPTEGGRIYKHRGGKKRKKPGFKTEGTWL
jgi:hypothetical protein